MMTKMPLLSFCFRHVLARLATLNSQCQEEYTKTIIEVSRANSPDTSENWKQLQGRMVQGMMEAQETVAFLEVLMVPCASLSKGSCWFLLFFWLTLKPQDIT